jgi:hypothetical protein
MVHAVKNEQSSSNVADLGCCGFQADFITVEL